jgi:photosystem II stability/assembly factor-like uncharacterized protein
LIRLRVASLTGRRIAVLAAIVVVAGASIGLAYFLSSSSEGTEASSASIVGSHVAEVGLVTSSFGWAVAPDGLFSTHDAGGSWTEIAPATVKSSAIRGVFFEDGDHGWVAASARVGRRGYVTVFVYRTVDGGSRWRRAEVTQPSRALTDAAGAPAYIDFVNPSHGWLMLRLVTSSAFSSGELFVTRDGGVSWAEQKIPIGGEISFIDARDGWTAGGASGDELFVTHDGGQTWAPERLALPKGVDPLSVGYDVPAQTANGRTVLPVTVDGPASRLIWYTSDDRGRRWTVHAVARSSQNLARGIRFAAAVSSAGSLVTDVGRGHHLDVADSRSAARSRRTMQGLSVGPDAAINQLMFADNEHGWAVLKGTECAGCDSYSALFETTDGGRDWTHLRP